MRKSEILKIRKQQENLEKRIYVCDKKYIELLKRCKEVRTYTWIADTYIDTLFEQENALNMLLDLKEQGFINFELKDRDIINYVAYKAKIEKSLSNL